MMDFISTLTCLKETHTLINLFQRFWLFAELFWTLTFSGIHAIYRVKTKDASHSNNVQKKKKKG